MAETLITEPPFEVPEHLEVYKDENNKYIIKDKATGDVVASYPIQRGPIRS